MQERVLMKGNEAFGAAAIRSGCRYYFGYPITPQNELTEYMSRELPLAGGRFIQAESELAAVNMAYGCAVGGGRALISSSSPGIALMQEGMSFLCCAELPLVVMNVSRGGPGIGGIQPGQADYFQATRGGGNGDYHIPVFAPCAIQEAADLISKAFETAEHYRNPVLILADGMMGQMMEPVALPKEKAPLPPEKVESSRPWALTGHEDRRQRKVIRALYLKPEELEEHNIALSKKYEDMKKTLVSWESKNLEEAQVVFVAFGTMARIVTEACSILEAEGIKTGLIRPITLWPFPYQAFEALGADTKLVISAELSMGQMIDDVTRAVQGEYPVGLIQRSGGMVPTPIEVAEKAKALLEVQK